MHLFVRPMGALVATIAVLTAPHINASLAATTKVKVEAAAKNLGQVETRVGPPDGEVSVILLPEVHGVPLLQLEQALVLQRLKNGPGVAAIVLEGLLPDDLANAKKLQDTDVGRGVALIQDGTLSAGEFMYSFRGVRLIPGETAETYGSEDSSPEVCGAIGRLSALTLQNRASAESRKAIVAYINSVKRINSITEDLNSVKPDSALSCDVIAKSEQVGRLTVESSRAIASLLPEMKSFVEQFCVDETTTSWVSIDEELDSLATLRGKLLQQADNDSVSAIDAHVKFLRDRDKASLVMIGALRAELSKKADGVVVAIIGAAHTNRMLNELTKLNISAAVVKVTSLREAENGNFRRGPVGRSSLLPTDRGPLGNAIASAALPKASQQEWQQLQTIAACDNQKKKKERIVLTTAWVQSKSEFHAAIDDLVKAAADGGQPPLTPGVHKLTDAVPPDDDRWKKTWVRLDVAKGVIVVSATGRDKSKVVVPVIFTNSAGQAIGEPIWTVAGMVSATPRQDSADSTKAVERLLEQAIKEERDRGPQRQEEKTDEKEGIPVRISMTTDAKVYRDRQGAMASVSNIK